MPFNNRTRKVGRIYYKSGEVKSLELPRDYWYRNLILKLMASETVATAAATPYTDNILNLIKRVEIIANGRSTIKSLDFAALSKLTKFFFGTEIKSNLPGTVGTNSGKAIAYVPFEMPRAVRGIDTILNSGKLSTFEIRITWATPSDLYSANAGNVTISESATYVDILLEEAFQSPGDEPHKPVAIFKQNFIEKTITSAGTAQVLLPVGNAYRGFLIKGEEDNDPSDSVVKKVELKSGTEVFFSEEFEATKMKNAVFYDLDSEETGYIFIDFCPDGLLTEALKTRDLSQLEFELTVAVPGSTNKVKIYPLELVPVEFAA